MQAVLGAALENVLGGARPFDPAQIVDLAAVEQAAEVPAQALDPRRIAEPAPARYPEVNASVYHFGLPDVSSRSADSIETQQQLAGDIEECLRIFEPRLTQVRVSIREAVEEEGRLARFVVEALLRMDPEPQRVVFDTVLETPTGTFFVRGGEDE